MNIIHSLKGLYAVFTPQGQIITWSANGHEEICKSLWLRTHQTLDGSGGPSWDDFTAMGFTCKRINVLYELAE